MTFKTITLAAVTIATLGSMAVADTSYFSYQRNLEAASTLDLGTVTSAGNGVVEIYDYRGGQQGDLLGSEPVNYGANTNVRVRVGGDAPDADVLAVITIDGQVVAEREFLID